MPNWQVRQVAARWLSADAYRILSWGFYTDGGAAKKVLPHIRACLKGMEIEAEVKAGDLPFFYVINKPSRGDEQTIKAFEELMSERTIRGPYNTHKEKVKMLLQNKRTRIVTMSSKNDSYKLELATDDKLLTYYLRGVSLLHYCKNYTIANDRKSAQLEVTASNPKELARRLRLIANMAAIRWDPADSNTLAIVGKPLL